jgi:hypothetical protein
VTRVLDIDLDFFLHGTAHWRAAESGRLDSVEYPPWSRDEALAFLHDRCKLTDPLPGLVVENHGELFERWAAAIAAGQLMPPLSVAHIDAHADLGLGDAGYVYVLTELLFLPVEERRSPRAGVVTDGNWLAFAIACRWVSDLMYIRNGMGGGRPGDLMPYFMEDFNLDASNIELAAMTPDQFERRMHNQEYVAASIEPKVPLQSMSWREFEATEPFDVICLAHSPDFTPAELDPLFDEIRERFIEEGAFR